MQDETEVENNVLALKNVILTLSEFVKDKNNVHGEIKRLIRQLQMSATDLEEEVEKQNRSLVRRKNVETVAKGVQTSRRQKNTQRERPKSSNALVSNADTQRGSSIPLVNDTKDEEWKVVSHKKKSKVTQSEKVKRPKLKKQKPDAS